MSQSYKKYDNWSGSLFRLSMYYAQELRRLSVLYFSCRLSVEALWVKVLNMMFIFIHSCDIGNICYLLSAFILWSALVLVLDWRLSTEHVVAQPLHLCLFSQVWMLWVVAVLYSILWFSQKVSSTVELCNSLSNIYVILNKKSYVFISFESLCKAVWADHLSGQCLL